MCSDVAVVISQLLFSAQFFSVFVVVSGSGCVFHYVVHFVLPVYGARGEEE